MRCPYCRDGDSRVVDSRDGDDGAVTRRRRVCQDCARRFSTVEAVSLHVLKRSGTSEPFSREKVIAGVRKACQGRPVDADALARLAQQVEESVRAGGGAEVPAHEVGLAILSPLRSLDEVAYLRFASVYRGFDSLADFEHEIALLRHERNAAVGLVGTGPDGLAVAATELAHAPQLSTTPATEPHRSSLRPPARSETGLRAPSTAFTPR